MINLINPAPCYDGRSSLKPKKSKVRYSKFHVDYTIVWLDLYFWFDNFGRLVKSKLILVEEQR